MLQLSTTHKKIILHLTVIIIVILNLAVFRAIHQQSSTDITQHQTKLINQYISLCTQHAETYNAQADEILQFSFYENYDNLVLTNRKLNPQYKAKINKFSTITQQQYFRLYQLIEKVAIRHGYTEISKLVYEYYDWSSRAVRVKHDRGYNATYVFGVLAAIEYKINENVTDRRQWVSLSAQEVIDCCEKCRVKQRPESVYQYVKENGVTVQAVYPYESSRFDRSVKRCRRDDDTIKYAKRYTIKGYISLHNCESLTVALSSGPVVVGIDGRSFDTYKYSTFSHCSISNTPNHYALAVGVNYNSWKLQNSWGQKWGERGYIRLEGRNTCGVCMKGTYPLFEE